MKRKQLTLFLETSESESIERIRKKFNPKQFALIKSHITLCREDEIEDLSLVLNNLAQMEVEEFELSVNGLERFSEGKGVFIKMADEERKFHQLRTVILQNGHSVPREHQAHITLMHPRNSTCDDEKFKAIQQVELPQKLRIRKICLIEQEMGKAWRVLREYSLRAKQMI
ncbi:MAG: 2'-5' RNA ligase family protein [Bacteroidota bacterium]